MVSFLRIKRALLSPAVISAVLFQLGWFVCIFAPNLLVYTFFFIYVVVHYLFICRVIQVWLFSLRLFFIGIAIDSFWVFSGVIDLQGDLNVIPIWLVALWAMFALCVPFGFSFLRKNALLAIAFGFFGAPISYFGGAAIRDDVMLSSPLWLSLVYIGVSWAIVLLLSNFIQEKMKLFTLNQTSPSLGNVSK